MNLKNKNVVIYGVGRIQEDFEYLFSNISVKKYIDKNLNEYKGNNVESLDNYVQNRLKNDYIIITLKKDVNIDQKFNSLGLKYKKDYVYFEDLGYLLDDKIEYILAKIKLYLNKFVKKNENYTLQYIKCSDMLKKMIYSDTYEGIDCMYPFEYVNIQPNGDVYSCCESWGYHNIGNLFVNDTDKIWNSNSMKLHRLAIINRTYAYCDVSSCPYLKENMKKDGKRNNDLKPLETPQKVYISIDRSCNLHCKSCRKNKFDAKGIRALQVNSLYRRLINSKWVLKSKRMIVAGQGEVFYSKVYQKLIFDENVVKNRESIEILSNGTLATKQKMDKLCEAYSDIKMSITVDAATEKTYNKIRLGGNFNNIINNFEYLSELRKNNKVKYIELIFVVQNSNYREMIDFIKMAKKYNFDKVGFSQISNWGTFTDKEFKKVSMLKKDGKPKRELKKILKNKIFKDPMVNYTNITKFID